MAPSNSNARHASGPPAGRPASQTAHLSEEKLAAIFRLSPDMIIITTRAEGRCLEVNDAFLRLTGYTRDEVIGRTTAQLKFWADPAQRNQMLARLAERGTLDGLEIEYCTKTDRRGYALFYAAPIEIDGEPCLVAMAQDITPFKQAQADLHARNEELEAFAQTVAHDLKSPLGNIMGFAEWLQARPDMPAEVRQDYINIIARNAFKMGSIIDELLLLARVRPGDVNAQPVDMGRVVSEALHRLTFVIAESGALISAPDHWPAAVGYAPWIEEVWVNYLSNAIKHGGRPPRVELGAERLADNMVRYWVKDNGPGVAPEARENLFRPFTQLTKVRATGHGLGLSIVRHIVEKMGGAVGFDCTAEGGSLFWFTLPSVS